ncbi:MAG: hypothetical protein ACI3W5_05835 [Faecousia sp.]
MGVIWYILGVISGVIVTVFVSCSVVSGRISREEEMRELAEKREECREDGKGKDVWYAPQGDSE